MDIQDVTARRGIAQLALKGFFSLAARWQLSRPEAMTLLGLTATSTYANWKNNKTSTLPRDTLERISYLLSIDETLKHFHKTDTTSHQWLRHPCTRLSGLSPMGHMLQGNVIDIYHVQVNLNPLLEQEDGKPCNHITLKQR